MGEEDEQEDEEKEIHGSRFDENERRVEAHMPLPLSFYYCYFF